MPLVTVGLPVYNGQDYIGECLESLFSQEFLDFEIVVHDNHSSDETAQIVEGFAACQDKLRLKRNEANIGALANFEKALFDADSRYFMWRAHDDLSDQNYIGALVEKLQNIGDAGLSVGRIRRQRVRGGEIADIREFPFNPPAIFDSPLSQFSTLAEKHMHQSWLYGLWDLALLRRYYRYVTDAYPHAWASDILILLCVLAKQKVVGTNEAVFTQRIMTKASQEKDQAAPSQALTLMDRRESFRNLATEMTNHLAQSKEERRRLNRTIDKLVERRVGSRAKLLKLQLKNAMQLG